MRHSEWMAMLTEVRDMLYRLDRKIPELESDIALSDLLIEIVQLAGVDRFAFSGVEIMELAGKPGGEALQTALCRCVGQEPTTKKLGRLLWRNQGRLVEGMRIVRQGEDGVGAIWAVVTAF